MSGRRPWSEIKRPMTPEGVVRAEEASRAMDTVLALAHLRETHEAVLNGAPSPSPWLHDGRRSRLIERREDEYLATLDYYVKELGGELHIVAVFPDETYELVAPAESASTEVPASDAVLASAR